MSVEALTRAVAGHGLPTVCAAWPAEPLPDQLWRAVLDRAKQQRFTGLLLDAVRAGSLPTSDAQYEDVAEAHLQATLRVLVVESASLPVIQVLADSGIPSRVLKGSAVAHLDYPDPSLRHFGDLDLLVRSEDYDRTVEVLGAAGLKRARVQARPGFDRRFGKGATCRAADGREVDLHRTFVMGPFGLRIRLEDLWGPPAEFEVGGQVLHALDAEGRFLHACYHAAIGDVPPRLPPLRDVAQMLLLGSVDEARLRWLMERWQAEAVVARAVRLTWATLGLQQPVPLSRWALTHVPSGRQAQDLAVYVDPAKRSYAAKSLASLAAIPSWRDKAAFAYALARPRPGFVPPPAPHRDSAPVRHAVQAGVRQLRAAVKGHMR